jgi:hypothetical protein
MFVSDLLAMALSSPLCEERDPLKYLLNLGVQWNCMNGKHI